MRHDPIALVLAALLGAISLSIFAGVHPLPAVGHRRHRRSDRSAGHLARGTLVNRWRVRLLHGDKCVHAFQVDARNAAEALERAGLADLFESLDAETISVDRIDVGEE